MNALLRAVAALCAMAAVAAVVFFASRGHVLFFPFVLILGAPLLWLLRPPRDRT